MATPGLESYKSDCGLGDLHDMEYAILLDGTITGKEGTMFEGTELTMSHQPANEYFGFQFGVRLTTRTPHTASAVGTTTEVRW